MREKIIQEVIKNFEIKGVKFTLDDIAKGLSISKKSIYEYFSGKDDLLTSTVDYVFDDVLKQQYDILASSMSNVDKLKNMLCVYPSMMQINDEKMDKFEELYPSIYKHIHRRFVTNWEMTFKALNTCIESGELKVVEHNIFKTIFVGLFDSVLNQSNQQDLLRKCIDVIFEGLSM